MNDKELSVVKSNEIIEARYRLDVFQLLGNSNKHTFLCF
jgi:hypothetical protein